MGIIHKLLLYIKLKFINNLLFKIQSANDKQKESGYTL